MRHFLDGLRAPVLLIDENGQVVSANQRAEKLTGKKYEDMHGLPGGEVFECAYARLPGGCGHTEHCKGCAIRNAVMWTHRSGDSIRELPAYQDIVVEGEVQKLRFLISTEKMGRTVLLRVEDYHPYAREMCA
jgi:PAS domain-containing protein